MAHAKGVQPRSTLLRRALEDQIRRGALDRYDGADLLIGDSFDILSMIPTGSVDLIYVDPPYFLSNGGSAVSAGKRVTVDKGAWDKSAGLADDHQFHRRWLRECQRLLSASGTIWVSGTHHAIFNVGWAMQCMGWEILNCVSWYKPNATPNFGCRQLTHSCEFVIWAAPRHRRPMAHTFNYAAIRRANGGKQVRDFWTLPRTPAKETRAGKHPTQKPRELLRRIILASSRAGDTMLEPFAGSGMGGVVARELGRAWIGIERDPQILDLARRNLGSAA